MIREISFRFTLHDPIITVISVVQFNVIRVIIVVFKLNRLEANKIDLHA